MSRRAYAGGAAATTLSSGITSGAVSIPVADASTWPGSGAFSVVIDRGQVGEEKILIASRSGNTLTVSTRGYDSTSAAAHSSGATIEHVGTSIDFDEANDHVNSTSAVHTGASLSPATLVIPGATAPAQTAEGSAVWDTDDDALTVGTGAGRKTLVSRDSTETLTNKTLTTPTIGDFTNANHTHASTAQGGGLPFVGCRANRTTNLSLTDSTLTVIPLDNEFFDTDAFHSTVSNTERFTIPAGKAGKYLISGECLFTGNATGGRALYLMLNGLVTVLSQDQQPSAGSGTAIALNVGTIYSLSVGDYVQLAAYQNSGGALSLLASGSGAGSLSMVYLGA